MKKTLTILATLSSLGACAAATYSFFTPTQTTNVVNGLIGASTYGSTAYNSSQFSVVPYTSIAIKSGASITNTSLVTPTISGGTQSGASYQSIKTPGLTGLLYGNDTGNVTVLAAGTTNRVLKWGTALAPTSGSIIDDNTNVNSTLPFHANVGLTVGGGAIVYKIISTNATLDFPQVTQHNSTNLTMTANGASPLSTVLVTVDGGGMEPFVFTGYVSATNTVNVRAINPHSSALDPASATYRVTVFNHN